MRAPSLPAAPRLTLILAAVVLLGVGATLGFRPAPAFDSRDAWVASIGRGEHQLVVPTMAREWRSDIAAQQHLLRRDRWLGGVLLATGVLALIAGVAAIRASSGRRVRSA